MLAAGIALLAGSWGSAPCAEGSTARILVCRTVAGSPEAFTGEPRNDGAVMQVTWIYFIKYFQLGAPGAALPARSCTGFRVRKHRAHVSITHLTGDAGLPAGGMAYIPRARGVRQRAGGVPGKRVSSSGRMPSLPAIFSIMPVLGCLRPDRMARMYRPSRWPSAVPSLSGVVPASIMARIRLSLTVLTASACRD